MKLFDMHCHTSAISRCCRLNREEILTAAKEAGYDGIVLTNHYTRGYLGKRSYAEWVEDYIGEYEKTKALSTRFGVDVLFGVEVTYEHNPAVHILLYGADGDFLRKNPELYNFSSEELFRLCDTNGICVIHAHPFRNGVTPLPYDHCHGYEINCHPLYGTTCSEKIRKMQKEQGFPVTCGCDYHGDAYRAKGGTFLPDSVTDEKVLAQFLRTTKSVTLKIHEINAPETYTETFPVR